MPRTAPTRPTPSTVKPYTWKHMGAPPVPGYVIRREDRIALHVTEAEAVDLARRLLEQIDAARTPTPTTEDR